MNYYEMVTGYNPKKGCERNIKNLWKRDSTQTNKGYITGRKASK